MKPFWRVEPLTNQEQQLLDAALLAHSRSAGRGNISGQVALMASIGSGNYTASLCAAMLTTGGVHAPLVQTHNLLNGNSEVEAKRLLDSGSKVPGWGNSFIKGKKDDLWLEVDQIICEHFHSHWMNLESVTALVHKNGKQVFPNPSAYTAITAIILKIPAGLSPWIFFAGRLNSWSGLICFGKDTWE